LLLIGSTCSSVARLAGKPNGLPANGANDDLRAKAAPVVATEVARSTGSSWAAEATGSTWAAESVMLKTRAAGRSRIELLEDRVSLGLRQATSFDRFGEAFRELGAALRLEGLFQFAVLGGGAKLVGLSLGDSPGLDHVV
jgi:hypothetical protein